MVSCTNSSGRSIRTFIRSTKSSFLYPRNRPCRLRTKVTLPRNPLAWLSLIGRGGRELSKYCRLKVSKQCCMYSTLGFTAQNYCFFTNYANLFAHIKNFLYLCSRKGQLGWKFPFTPLLPQKGLKTLSEPMREKSGNRSS